MQKSETNKNYFVKELKQSSRLYNFIKSTLFVSYERLQMVLICSHQKPLNDVLILTRRVEVVNNCILVL